MSFNKQERRKQRLEDCGRKPRNAGCHQELQEAKKGLFLSTSRGNTTLTTL